MKHLILWYFRALARSKPYVKSRFSGLFLSLWYQETGLLQLLQAVSSCPVRPLYMQL